MLERLNTYIIKQKIKCVIALGLFMTISNVIWAQTSKLLIQPLTKSQLKYNTFDVYVYGAASYQDRANLWTATNNVLSARKGEEWYVDVGATIETSWSHVKGLHLCSSIGYKRVKYNYIDEDIWENGVVSNWLSVDVNCDYTMFGLGIKSDVLLNTKIINQDDFSYIGLNASCFNKITFCPYASFILPLTKLKIEGRIGYYIAPYFNVRKIALNNFYTTHYDGLYWEVRIATRLFTSGTQIKSTGIF